VIDLDIGDALLQIGNRLQRLQSELPRDAELHCCVVAKELTITIYLNDVQNLAYRFTTRREPRESPMYERSELAKLWRIALRELRVSAECRQQEPAK